MIQLTRLGGQVMYLNPHQFEAMEETPDTVIRLITGEKYVVRDKVAAVIERIIDYRRRIYGVDRREHFPE
mgnify:CR=1 FL=1